MNNRKSKIAIAGILLMLCGSTIADNFRVAELSIVDTGSIHIHKTTVKWDITDGERVKPNTSFYLGMKLRTAPLKEYYETHGDEVDNDAARQAVGDGEPNWAKINQTVTTTHTYPEVGKNLCSKSTFELIDRLVVDPRYQCSAVKSLCTDHLNGSGGSGTDTASRINDDSCNERWDPPASPILIDLGQDGFDLGQPGVGVNFDLFATGTPIHIQWVAPGGNESFLVLDLNDNGFIDDGSELFGEGTALINEQDSPTMNGYIALQQYDSQALGGNEDGLITAEDEVWSKLELWNDANADAVSTPAEMSMLSDSGITELHLRAKKSPKTDDADNLLKLWSWARDRSTKPQTKYQMVDVFFKQLN